MMTTFSSISALRSNSVWKAAASSSKMRCHSGFRDGCWLIQASRDESCPALSRTRPKDATGKATSAAAKVATDVFLLDAFSLSVECCPNDDVVFGALPDSKDNVVDPVPGTRWCREGVTWGSGSSRDTTDPFDPGLDPTPAGLPLRATRLGWGRCFLESPEPRDEAFDALEAQVASRSDSALSRSKASPSSEAEASNTCSAMAGNAKQITRNSQSQAGNAKEN
mmetsp:Transcript_132273/g.300591  ORF Transcript_132273/g.300591 Transcript_132273/m.300591 type:complete len:223 (+) Transcript_132273:909-1577(+)